MLADIPKRSLRISVDKLLDDEVEIEDKSETPYNTVSVLGQ